MSLPFIVSNFNNIALIIWTIFFGVVVLRVVRPLWIKNISYTWLIVIATTLHLLYGALATWGQYIAWSQNEFTRVFLSSSLSSAVPFPQLLEWTRPFFSGPHGYFAFYSFGHFFLSTIVLIFITIIFALFFKIYSRSRPSVFEEGGIAIIILAFLIAGWPNATILVPLAFLFAVLFALINIIRRVPPTISLAHSFLLVVPLTFFFGVPILKYLNLYLLLKL